jgi:hypothetical protein
LEENNRISRNRWFRVFLKRQRITELHIRTGGFMGSYFTFEKRDSRAAATNDRTG